VIVSNNQRVYSKTGMLKAADMGWDMESASKEGQEESRAYSPGLEPDKLPG
jgi:hypothetical protein